MSHYVASAATPTIVLLLPDTDGVADTGDYYSIAWLAPFQDEALDPLDNFLSSLHDLLLHRRNRFLNTLLNDHSVDSNLVDSPFLLNLVSLRAHPAFHRPDVRADITCGLSLEFYHRIHHDHHRHLTTVLFDDRLDGVPRFPNVSARTLRLQSNHPAILHHRLGNNDILLDLTLL